MAQSTHTIIEILLNHIALPARLPGRQDENPNVIESQLIRRLLKATRFILDIPNFKHIDCWSSLYRSLLSSKSVNENGGLSASEIITALRELRDHDFVLLHLTEQNAGVTVSLQNSAEGKELLFEVSEASAKSENVLASSNALLWDFPTSAVALPLSSYFKYDLEHELATFLAQAGNESVKHVASHTNKADSQAYESRDTIDPVIISGLLMTILKGRGRKFFSPKLRKRVRDDVCWDGTGVNPWRRSPMWLLLRVAVERHLCTSVGPDLGHLYFKLLMCLFHSNFLVDYTKSSQIQEDLLHHLIQKLVARIDKLHNREAILENESASHFIVLRNALEEKLKFSVERSANKLSHIMRTQNNLYESISTVHRMPFRAQDKYCRFKLLNSDKYISEVLNSLRRKNPNFTCHNPKNINIKVPVPEYIISATELYLRSARIDSQIETSLQQHQSESKTNESCEVQGQAIAQSIEDYLTKVGGSYDDNPEQKSKMLLIVLELWVELDKCAIQSYGLLKNFSPGIPCEVTNVLLLLHMEDIKRLRRVQEYLIKRQKESGDSTITIFDQPSKNCFAVQYYNNSPDQSVMKKSLNQIEKDAQKKREDKKKNLSKMSEKYKLKVAKESVMSHKIINEYHDMGKCPKCYRKREINKLKIDVHEWPLPSELIYVKTVIFELHCPTLFSTYRDISWLIIADLALVSVESKDPRPELLFRDYTPLSTYATTRRTSRFTLASKAKFFNKTHYKTIKLPAREADVCVPNGAKFRYFDAKNSVWPTHPLVLSFAHHCRLLFPKESSYSSLNKFLGFAENRPGPSSYSIIASRPRCPRGILIQEFLSIQSLFSGYEHRWLQILIELGSSNINFSTESTSCLMNFLILQVGPRDPKDARGITHRIFLDRSFCTRLIYWVNLRLNEISSVVRRREIFCMEILITLSVRLFELGSPIDKKEGFNLVKKARDITIKWLSRLEEDIKNAKCFEMSEKFSRYATWAALLCRRTYVVFSETIEGDIPHSTVSSYLESTIALQEYLSDNETSLDFSLKAALIRDAKIIWNIRCLLRSSLTMPVIISVIKRYIPNLAFTPTSDEKSIKFLSPPQEWFISILTEKSTRNKQQHITFNLLTGHLLIDGKPMGKLPDEWRQSEIYKELFNTEIIHIWPSQLSGMDYKLNRLRCGQEVHFGIRAGKKIIQAITQSEHLEYIPSKIFLGVPTSDMPVYLVHECVHWLNFRTECIEIRQISNPWKYGPTDWSIDLNERIVFRYKSNKRWILIDPHSTLFKAISHIFKGFEKYSEIVVIQTDQGGIKLSMPRLELKFHINENRLFECDELGSEIDPNQDIRSWYGLKSKLVLRGIARSPVSQTYFSKTGKSYRNIVTTTHRRSILVPTGNIHCERNGANVEVKVTNNGSYARFLVNEVLGRIETIDSSDEYLKALYHAVTSRPIPDPLTGRTGTEEAIHCLNSAYCQPATPLSNPQKVVLQKIASLTPNREFYPKHMKSMQMTSWNEDLTTSIQHDGFRYIVDQILEKSQQLSMFFDDPSGSNKILKHRIDKLNERNLVRRNTYCRSQSIAAPIDQTDSPYSGHRMIVYLNSLLKVQKCTELIQNWSQSLPTTKNLGKILAGWSNFQGFGLPINEFLISDLIDMKISNHWGSLVNTMRNFHKPSMYKLTFFLGIISFS
ncbi:putative p-loop containing nucleoside triphosphate hydrolase [Erysiphe neolycopersici]|uniref:ubiquitinyl hydrolase 1 n=1 Tax=Erysiphe neolycopersici TaxID=212602 RepID=A0A420HKM9_9PEZI|nr:putative p-loop containing nucleoside triphosphate hydrolase [Erysiphe neolycopersici]